MRRADFKKLSLMRLEDAKVLLRSKRESAAYYLDGDAVESAVKACIARQTRRFDFPPPPDEVRNRVYTLNLEILSQQVGVQELLTPTGNVEKNWNLVKSWSAESRYHSKALKEARDFLKAIEDPVG